MSMGDLEILLGGMTESDYEKYSFDRTAPGTDRRNTGGGAEELCGKLLCNREQRD